MSNLYSIFGKAMNAKEYSDQWRLDSDSFAAAGMYDWMVQQLGPQELIVEIGCGTGHSTYALAKSAKVICIEPNPHMAEVCLEYLLSKGIDASITHDLAANPSSRVVIVAADVFDQAIEPFLCAAKPDAIICWLVGAEPERISKQLETELVDFTGKEMPQYREQIHKRCYGLGGIALPPKGTIQIVDRLFISAWNEKDMSRRALAEMHQEFAGESYDVSFDSTRFTRYQKPFSTSQIQMMAEENPEGRVTVFGSVKGLLSKG